MADETPSGVFISYSRQSSEFVDKLEADLNARSFDAWVDRQKLAPGQSWPDTIKQEIQQREKMIVVITRAALGSEWVKNEYEYALLLKRPIIPVLLESVPVEEWPIQFVSLQYADFQKSYESGLTELLRSLALPGQQLRAQPVAATNVQEDASQGGNEGVSQPSLRELYTLGVTARARDDLERAAILWEQIVERDSSYLGGTVKAELEQIEPQLRPMRIERLRQEAQDGWRAGEWGREIAAWRALLSLDANDREAKEELQIAQDNQ